jgi:ribosomal protein S12 methylthiotransferase
MGVFELNLVAQDTTAYGRDLTPPVALAELLRACDSFPGDYWLRLLYTHPASFGPDMMAVFRDSAHLVPYLDMPLQHIRDSLLKAMGRRFSEADTRRLVDRIREELPDVAQRTTFLVGFPGETDADFEALLAFVRETGFERLGVFAFSPEPGTPAAAMTEGLVPEAVAVDRCNAIMAAQQEIALEHNRRLVGETLSVLLEAPEEDEGDWWGRTTWDAPDIDDGVLVQGVPDDPLPVVHARVTAAGAYDLEAVFVSPA